MSFDLVMRTLGVVACLYTVAYFVTIHERRGAECRHLQLRPHVRRDGVRHRRRAPPRLMPGQGRDAEPLWIAASFLQND